MTMTFAFPRLGNITLPYDGGVDIEQNDLIFLCPSSPYPLPTGLTADVAYPAASMPDQGTAARNQRLFAKNFAGVSVERHLSSSNSTNDEMNTDVTPIWVGDVTVPSQVYIPGMLVGVAENSGKQRDSKPGRPAGDRPLLRNRDGDCGQRRRGGHHDSVLAR
jgi:hypothetical protein